MKRGESKVVGVEGVVGGMNSNKARMNKTRRIGVDD